MTKSVKKFIILLVAMLMCLAVVFAACGKAVFTPVEPPADGDVDSNGGIAVRYGEWLYYVNGYTSNVSADNTYTDDVKDAPRIGSVVRIRLSDIEKLFEINDDKDLSSTDKSKKIASAVRGDEKEDLAIVGAETVIPKIYYSGNATTTQFTGIYIFNKRIYVTTPSDELTPNGDPLTNQLVLMSFKLDGSDPQSHYTFTSNSAQIWLTNKNNKVIATYVMDSILHTLDVESGKDTIVSLENDPNPEIKNTVSSVNWDTTKGSEAVYFLDKFGSVCKLVVGETKYQEIVKNTDYSVHDHDGEKQIEAGDTTYTIKFVNNGMVYYTMATGVTPDNVVLYWATDAENNRFTALPTNSVSVNAWKEDKLIVTDSYKSGNKTFYSICIVDGKTYESKPILEYGENDSSITINKIEGDNLYYTADGISYVLDLTKAEKLAEGEYLEGEARGKNIGSTTGWAAPDFLNIVTEDGVIHYIITAGTDSVTITKFDAEDLKASTVSVSLTLTAAPDED